MCLDSDQAEVIKPRRRFWRWRARTHAHAPATVEAHVEAIRSWEQHLQSGLAPSQRLADWVSSTVGRGSIIAAHVGWFALWILLNDGQWGIEAFDPYPYPFLTLAVSLEAIFLSLFVLASQNRLADVADRRSQLHLQIDLLAEREMTAVLKMLCGIAARLDVPSDLTDEQMQDFTRPTDLKALAEKLDTLRGDGE
jgi:uncharacterized membrane protein